MAKTKKSVAKKVVKTKAPKSVAPKTAEKKEGEYELSITICGQKSTTKTDDIKEAILSFKPAKLSGKILFTIKHGAKEIERVMHPFQARKLFINELMAEFFTKNIMLRLK